MAPCTSCHALWPSDSCIPAESLLLDNQCTKACPNALALLHCPVGLASNLRTSFMSPMRRATPFNFLSAPELGNFQLRSPALLLPHDSNMYASNAPTSTVLPAAQHQQRQQQQQQQQQPAQ